MKEHESYYSGENNLSSPLIKQDIHLHSPPMHHYSFLEANLLISSFNADYRFWNMWWVKSWRINLHKTVPMVGLISAWHMQESATVLIGLYGTKCRNWIQTALGRLVVTAAPSLLTKIVTIYNNQSKHLMVRLNVKQDVYIFNKRPFHSNVAIKLPCGPKGSPWGIKWSHTVKTSLCGANVPISSKLQHPPSCFLGIWTSENWVC